THGDSTHKKRRPQGGRLNGCRLQPRNRTLLVDLFEFLLVLVRIHGFEEAMVPESIKRSFPLQGRQNLPLEILSVPGVEYGGIKGNESSFDTMALQRRLLPERQNTAGLIGLDRSILGRQWHARYGRKSGMRPMEGQ